MLHAQLFLPPLWRGTSGRRRSARGAARGALALMFLLAAGCAASAPVGAQFGEEPASADARLVADWAFRSGDHGQRAVVGYVQGTGSHRDTPGWRHFMTRELMAHWAHKAGFAIESQHVFDWRPGISDCFTMLRRQP